MTGRPGFEALAPFFRIIAEGLSGLVDGEDFFDTLAVDAVFEYVVSVPGYPRRVVGREAVAERQDERVPAAQRARYRRKHPVCCGNTTVAYAGGALYAQSSSRKPYPIRLVNWFMSK